MLVKLAATGLELLLPYILEYMIDYIAPQRDVGRILLWGGIMICLALVVRFLSVGANRGSVRIAKKCIYKVRQDLFTKSMNLSGDQMDETGLPSLISRMTSDSYNLQSFMQTVQTLAIRAPILLFGGIIITLTMDTGLALVLIIMAPILLVAVVIISRKGIPLYDIVQTNLDSVVRILRENITGIRVVKALSKEEYEKRRFEKSNETMNRSEIKASVVMSLPGPVISLAMNVGLTLVVLIGALRVNKGVTEPGVILAFLTYFQMILMGVLILNRFFLNMSKANASANRIAAVMHSPEGLAVRTDVPKAPSDDFIIFDKVSFNYGAGLNAQSTKDDGSASRAFAGGHRENTLIDIDFRIPKGGSLGIIGATGSGKTTIINLLMRFYDPQQGNVFIEGKDVRSYGLDDLRRRFGVVFQNDAIFADTIAENISFGRDVTEEGLKSAATDAMANEFIEGYDDNYLHQAAIHGANFSGGQKQRLLISRALAAHPEILILDDSSSALDYRTDAQLRHNIREHYGDTTMIVVAQRVSSIMNMDQIIVLEEGRIIGKGTHAQLLESTPQYREIFETQMGEV
ncbi:MAG: ABC transporter ATP-binding protein [Spirochaetales bacterium]|nr:ABC transporter ATP-binding protein [Spirochaetales bacterium]